MDSESQTVDMEKSSHKVIEKRRRDRINNCLAELSQTVPSVFAKQTSGKLEKAEILEMTVEYLRAIQATDIGIRYENGEWFSGDIWSDFLQHYQLGYNDCMREVVRYMTDVEGICLNDSRCVRILSYLQTRFRPNNSINCNIMNRNNQSLTADNISCVASRQSPNAMTTSTRRFSPYLYHSNLQSRLVDSQKCYRKDTTRSPSNIFPFLSSSIRPVSKLSQSLPLNVPYQHDSSTMRGCNQ